MKIIKTKDGSNTLYSQKYKQHYHSLNDGALNESLQKHIIPAFKYIRKKKSYNILDICYGLGFNTLATLYYIDKVKIDAIINIYSPELDIKLIKSLSDFEYPKEFRKLKDIINSISKYNKFSSDKIEINIYNDDAIKYIRSLSFKMDIVYQDPFSVDVNSSLWSLKYFNILSDITTSESIITTYSQSSRIRYTTHLAGFYNYIYKGKNSRESTIISKRDDIDLKLVNLDQKLINNPDLKAIL